MWGKMAWGVKGWGASTAPAVSPYLNDDFNDNSRNTALWNLGQNYNSSLPTTGITVSETGGRVQITNTAATMAGGGYISVNDYPITSAWLTFDATTFATSSNHLEPFFAFGDDTGTNRYAILFFISGGVKKVGLYRKVGATQTLIGTLLTYSATTHKWWRLRYDGTNAYFDTAPSTATSPPLPSEWVNQATEVWDAGVPTTGKISFGLGSYDTTTPASTIGFDNFGSTLLPAVGSASAQGNMIMLFGD